MNIRLGFARLARVTAVAYLLVAVATVALVSLGAWNERQRDLHPQDFTVKVTDGRSFLLRAGHEWEAQNAAENYASGHPVPPLIPGHVYSDAEVFSWEKPTRLTLPEYDHPPSLGSVIWKGLVWAFWFAATYVALWAFFRVARWVVLGFMAPAPSDRPNA